MEAKCKELARLMADTVYPKLWELMEHVNIKDTEVKAAGSKDMIFQDDGTIKWVTKETDGRVREACNMKVKGFAVCPIMNEYKDKNVYLNFCNAMMDKVDELEKEVSKIDAAIERASKIGVVCTRVVIVEKIIKDKTQEQ